jgi:outer membrane protein insertion porin family
MKALSRSGLIFALWVACSFVLHAQPSLRIHRIEIDHVGPKAVSDALVRANIRTKVGDPYSPPSIDADVQNLYATGYFTGNIRVLESLEPEGVVLTYIVQGKLRLADIHFQGNAKFSDNRLRKKVSSKSGDMLDEYKLFTDAREIRTMYEKAGMQGTQVETVISADESAGRANVVFEVDEAPRIKIANIDFEGNETFSDRRLRKILKTKRRWMFSWLTGSGVLKPEEFEDDKNRLIEFYQNAGYIDVEIKDVEFDYVSPTKMVIRFDISEGRRYQVGDLQIRGNRLFTEEEIMSGIVSDGRRNRIEMLVGEYFTPVGLRSDTEAIRDFYGSKGYIDTRVSAIRIPNIATGTIDLIYEIQEGGQSFIEKIDIKGNIRTKDKVIRRELAVSPGEPFDAVRVRQSKSRLEQMGYFSRVETRDEETDDPALRNLVIGVEEKNTGNFTIGAGLSSVDNVVGFAELSQGNFDLFNPPTFTGGGQKFRLRTQIGTRRQDYQISFIEPWFLDRKLALGVDLYHRELNFLSDLYDESHTGASLSLTRALWIDDLIGRIGYTIESIDVGLDLNSPIISEELKLEQGRRLVSKVGTSLAYDTRDNVLMPSRGQRSEILAEVAGGPMGGDTDFYKLELRTAWYFPMYFEGHILELVGRSGVVDSYGSGDRGRDRVPIFDRWFLGGLYTLRGYRYRTVGPRDVQGEPIGGNTYVFGSAEYTLPIIERLRFALFYDIGNVYSGAYEYDDLGNFSDNWGVGLRINLPIGPLRLDYAFPIRHDPAVSGRGRFQFGVGYHREF